MSPPAATAPRWPRVASLQTPAGLRAHLEQRGAPLPCDDEAGGGDSPLASPLDLGDGHRIGNRFVIQPMEGWDGTPDGRPSDLTVRRWRNFGAGGAGWIWGGEAVAVQVAGRANPNQLVMNAANAPSIGALRQELVDAAREAGHREPLVGLQLTHSGRWSAPERGSRQPRVAYRHPVLDARVDVADDAVLSDREVEELIESYARAAKLAREAGFQFVDLKHCHGYLLHEFLSARTRAGRYGGPSLADRSRLIEALVAAVRHAAPDLTIGVRLSAFDGRPHRAGQDGIGIPEDCPLPYQCAFGLDPQSPDRPDLREPIALAHRLVDLGVRWLNVTASSPYYAPHLQRPALFPPSDGYLPPEDPLVGVARLLGAARDIKAAVPAATVVASGLSYLQDFLPHVAQACIRNGWFDAAGLGRVALSYPDLPADVLNGTLERRKICRTFSDCTTAPRKGLVSGCYPLDPFYRERPEAAELNRIKRELRR